MAKERRTGKPAQNFIFRSIALTTPEQRAEARRMNATPKVFLKFTDIIYYPYKNVDGKQKALPLDLDLSEIKAWEEGVDGAVEIFWLPRTIRYIVGANSPFADEQGLETNGRDENGRNLMLDNPSNRDALVIATGELKLKAMDSVLANYLWMMNQCKNQHPKVRQNGNAIKSYYKVDFGEIDEAKVELGKLRNRMYKVASTASVEEMMAHSSWLGIPHSILETEEDREYDAIREDYKQAALDNPKVFEETSSDPVIKLIFVIKNLQSAMKISINGILAGQAHWYDTKKLITQLPPDKEPVRYLAEFALTKEGEAFMKAIQQLKSYTGLINA